MSVGGSQQQPKHTTDPGQPRLPAQLLCGCQGARCSFWKKYLPGLALRGRPACPPCEGRRGLLSGGRLLSAPERTAGPLKLEQEQGGEGAGSMKQNIFAKNILVQEKIFFLFFPYSCWKTKVLLKQHQNISCCYQLGEGEGILNFPPCQLHIKGIFSQRPKDEGFSFFFLFYKKIPAMWMESSSCLRVS